MRTAKATTRGRVTVKGDFLTHPPRDAFRAVPDGLRIEIRDRRETDVSIDALACVISTSHAIRCDVKEPRVRVRIKPIPKTNETEYRFTFKFESGELVPPVDSPFEVTMTQLSDGIVRVGTINDCLSKSNGAVCNEP